MTWSPLHFKKCHLFSQKKSPVHTKSRLFSPLPLHTSRFSPNVITNFFWHKFRSSHARAVVTKFWFSRKIDDPLPSPWGIGKNYSTLGEKANLAQLKTEYLSEFTPPRAFSKNAVFFWERDGIISFGLVGVQH